MEQRPFCCSYLALSWFCSLVSSHSTLSRWGVCQIGECRDLWVDAVWGRWLCLWLAVLLKCFRSPPATPKNPPPYITSSLLLFCSCKDRSSQYSIRTPGGKRIVVWKVGWKEPLWYNFFFFFWWGLLHGPQQGPDRMKGKKPIRLGKGILLPKQKNPPWKTTVWEIGPRSQEHKLRVCLKNRQKKA